MKLFGFNVYGSHWPSVHDLPSAPLPPLAPYMRTQPSIAAFSIEAGETVSGSEGFWGGRPRPTLSLMWQTAASPDGPWTDTGMTSLNAVIDETFIDLYLALNVTAESVEGTASARSNILGPIIAEQTEPEVPTGPQGPLLPTFSTSQELGFAGHSSVGEIFDGGMFGENWSGPIYTNIIGGDTYSKTVWDANGPERNNPVDMILFSDMDVSPNGRYSEPNTPQGMEDLQYAYWYGLTAVNQGAKVILAWHTTPRHSYDISFDFNRQSRNYTRQWLSDKLGEDVFIMPIDLYVKNLIDLGIPRTQIWRDDYHLADNVNGVGPKIGLGVMLYYMLTGVILPASADNLVYRDAAIAAVDNHRWAGRAGYGNDDMLQVADPLPNPLPLPVVPTDPAEPVAEISSFTYMNSLFDHQGYGGADDDTRVPNWTHRMATSAGLTYEAIGLFGFAGQWELPPRDGVGYENAPRPAGIDYGSTWNGYSNINTLTFVPDNFDSFDRAPNVNSDNPSSPIGQGQNYLDRLLQIIDAWETNAPMPNGEKRRYCVYAGWADFGSRANGGQWNSYTAAQLTAYLDWSLGAYHQWYVDLVDMLKTARPTLEIELLDVQRVMMRTWQNTVLNTLTGSRLWEDNSPHGTETWYLLAAIVYYMEMYGAKPPATYNPLSGTGAGSGVDPVLINNWSAIVDYAWDELQNPTATPVTPVDPEPEPDPVDPPPTGGTGGLPADTVINWSPTVYNGPALAGPAPTVVYGAMRFGQGERWASAAMAAGFYVAGRIRLNHVANNLNLIMLGLSNWRENWNARAIFQVTNNNGNMNSFTTYRPTNNWEDDASAWGGSGRDYSTWATVEAWIADGVVVNALDGVILSQAAIPAAYPIGAYSELMLFSIDDGGAGGTVDVEGMVVMSRLPTEQERADIRSWVQNPA